MRPPPTKLRFALAVVAAVGVVVLGAYMLQSDYARFMSRSAVYHRDVARGCDLILRQHPLGSTGELRLSGADASLPTIIRKLKPEAVAVSAHRVWMGVGVGRGAFGVIWEQAEGYSNRWVLHTCAESWDRVVYEETR